MARHALEVDSRLEVLADALNHRHNKTSRRAIVAAITDLLPSLREHAAFLDDTTDPNGPLPAALLNEIRLLAQ